MTNPDAKRRSKKNMAVVGFLFGGGAAMAISNSGVAHADELPPQPHLSNPIVTFVEQQYRAPKPGTYYSEGVSQAWCANFVSYALREAGAPLGGINGWRNPAVVGLQKTFADKGILENRNYVPKPGDVVLYGGDHTNIVVEVNGDEIVTVGGNEDRGGISRRVISRHAGKITGYGRTSELVTPKPGDAPVDAFVAPAPAPAPAPEPHPVWGAPPPPPVPFDAAPPAPFVEPAPPAPVDHAVNPAPAPGPELPPPAPFVEPAPAPAPAPVDAVPPAPVDPFLPPPPPPAPVEVAPEPPAPVDPFAPLPPAPGPELPPPAPEAFMPPPPPAPMPWEQPAPAPAPEFFAPPAPEQLPPPPPPAPEPAPAPAPEAIPAADQLPIPPGPEGIWLLSALP